MEAIPGTAPPSVGHATFGGTPMGLAVAVSPPAVRSAYDRAVCGGGSEPGSSRTRQPTSGSRRWPEDPSIWRRRVALPVQVGLNLDSSAPAGDVSAVGGVAWLRSISGQLRHTQLFGRCSSNSTYAPEESTTMVLSNSRRSEPP